VTVSAWRQLWLWLRPGQPVVVSPSPEPGPVVLIEGPEPEPEPESEPVGDDIPSGQRAVEQEFLERTGRRAEARLDELEAKARRQSLQAARRRVRRWFGKGG